MFKFLSPSKKRTKDEIERELEGLKKDIKVEKKALQDLNILIRMYQNVKDQKGLQMTDKKRVEIEKNIETLRTRRKALKMELPPRPLPQPEFLPVSAVVSKATNSSSTQPSSKPTATVLYDYHPNGPDELEITAGQTVVVVQQYGYDESDSQWWQVETSAGSTGYVPSSYLASGPRRMVALYDYSAAKADELSFIQGDVIVVQHQQYPGWWRGELRGREGLLPANYVFDEQQISLEETDTTTTATTASESNTTAADSAASSSSSTNAEKPDTATVETSQDTSSQQLLLPQRIAPQAPTVSPHSSPQGSPAHRPTQLGQSPRSQQPPPPPPVSPLAHGQSVSPFACALFDYKPRYGDELSFQRGDIIRLTKREGSGWYRGLLQGQKEAMLVPGNYLQLPSSPEETELWRVKFSEEQSSYQLQQLPAKHSNLRTASLKEAAESASVARDYWQKREKQGEVVVGSGSQRKVSAEDTESEGAPLLSKQQDDKKEKQCCCIIL